MLPDPRSLPERKEERGNQKIKGKRKEERGKRKKKTKKHFDKFVQFG